jgi:Fe-S cluster assembly protein SufD
MDVIAHHAASIGRFNDEEMFYLKSRGLSQKEAIKLLIGGFFNEIINEMNEDIKNKFLTLIDSGVKEIE